MKVYIWKKVCINKWGSTQRSLIWCSNFDYFHQKWSLDYSSTCVWSKRLKWRPSQQQRIWGTRQSVDSAAVGRQGRHHLLPRSAQLNTSVAVLWTALSSSAAWFRPSWGWLALFNKSKWPWRAGRVGRRRLSWTWMIPSWKRSWSVSSKLRGCLTSSGKIVFQMWTPR